MEDSALTCVEYDSSTIYSRSSSSIQAEVFTEFSIFVDKLTPILDEMKDSVEVADLAPIKQAVDSLENEYKRAKAVIESQIVPSSPAKHIESLTQNLGRSLGLVLFASHDVPLSNKQKIEALCREMMNVRFEDTSSEDRESEFGIVNEDGTEVGTEEKTEEEIVEEEPQVLLGVDDVVWHITSGDEEGFKNALSRLNELIMDGAVCNEKVTEEDLVKVLSSRLRSSKRNERVIIIRILRYLIRQNAHLKEKMKDLEFLSALAKSLARDTEEQREAVGLLSDLSCDGGVRRKIGRIQGCILMLVAISNGNDDEQASHDARMLLNAMSCNTQHVLHMAEAGYFKPLIKHLEEGSDMSKVLMATALSRLELTDQIRSSLGQDGAIETLVKMFNTGNLEAKLSALSALQNLSSSERNIQRLIDTGIVVPLLQLLFSVTSARMSLREPASAILAKVAKSESILVKKDIAQQMLSLLSLSSPVIQNNLLEALNNIVLHSTAFKVRKKMKENSAIQLLVPFFVESDGRIRIQALNLVYTLSGDMLQEELVEQLGYSHIQVLANIVTSSAPERERVAALGILSNMPVNDKKITDILKNANVLPYMVSVMSLSPENPTPAGACLAESIAAVLIRFTIPTDKKLQHYSVENGVTHVLLRLLSSSSGTTKSRAVLCLAQLSQNSLHLSKSRKLKWLCVPSPADAFCEVHEGCCSVKSTFCLVKADAVTPLIRILESGDRGADEAVLGCIATLLQDEIWESGCNYLVKKSGFRGIINVLSSGSLKSQEKALWILERIFRVEAHRAKYGDCAQMVLIELAQNGDPVLKPTVAKLLAQLQLLQDQSTYF